MRGNYLYGYLYGFGGFARAMTSPIQVIGVLLAGGAICAGKINASS